MPPLTRYATRAAMIYLIAGLLTGALYWANTVWPIWPPIWALRAIYIHLLVVGWLTQLIFGVIYWMFPIVSKANPRGNTRLAVAGFAALNLGLLLRVVFEPWRLLEANALNGFGLLASALTQLLAGVLIVWVCWPRIRERGGS